MGRPAGLRLKMKLKCLCVARASPCVPVFSAKSSSASIKYGNIEEFPSISRQEERCCSTGNDIDDDDDDDEGGNNNKIMVVVDSSIEAQGALDWALTHAVQPHDTLILLHVAKPSIQDAEWSGKLNQKTRELLAGMKNQCERKRAGVKVKVKVVKVEGEEKGRAIVAEAEQRKVSLLILGQRKRSVLWCILRRWRRKATTTTALAHYCIQNASCMTIAVRRKNKKLGGFLITTKRHQNFWLLA